MSEEKVDVKLDVIVKEEKILRQRSHDVRREEIVEQNLFERLKRVLETTTGIGIAAIQIGIPLRYAVMRKPDGKGGVEYFELVNPKIIDRDVLPQPFRGEGCLSFPGKSLTTMRHHMIKVEHGYPEDRKVEEHDKTLGAIAIQHEIDHMDGILFMDRNASTTKLLSKRKIGRNDPCPCGSGKKYKKCCLIKSQTAKVMEKK